MTFEEIDEKATHPKKLMEFHYDLSGAGQRGFENLRTIYQEERPIRYNIEDRFLPMAENLPPILAADLVDIASAITWADRKGRRSRDYGAFAHSLGWMRTFHIILDVREPDTWNDPSIKSQLESLLGWLTEDTWHLSFRQQDYVRRPTDKQIQPHLPSDTKQPGIAVLFSGGLDSLAGTVALLERHPNTNLHLVSIAQGRLAGVNQDLTQILQRRHSQIIPTPILFHMVNHGEQRSQKEDESQRSRGFLFLACAAAMASSSNVQRILVCENGIGAINLPVSWCQLGTQNTRAVHPRTLNEMQRLLHALGLEISIEAPFYQMTKGEICKVLAASADRDLCQYTVSCDNFPNHKARPKNGVEWHCGECTSCLLRRQSISVAHLESEDVPQIRYSYDLCAPLLTRKTAPHEHLKYMVDQVNAIEQAQQTLQPQASMLATFPELVGAAHALAARPLAFGYTEGEDILAALCRLYARYAAEWQTFPYSLAHAH